MSKPPAKPPTITFGDGAVFHLRSVEIDYGPRDGYKSPKPPLTVSFDCHFDPGFGLPEAQEVTLQTPPRLGWVFPKDPFVIYEPKDEQWCRVLGIGYENMVQDTIYIPRAIVTPKDDGTVEIIPLSEVNYIQGGLL